MPENNNQRKPFIFYYLLVIVSIIVINSLLLPAINQARIKRVNYNTFIEHVDRKDIEELKFKDDDIFFTLDEDASEIFVTGNLNDGEIINKLIENEIDFERVPPSETNPLVLFFLQWILPMVIFGLIGRFFMGMMIKRMGAGPNAMQFGDNEYVPAETGKSFDDVAGQDEAKESLNEIVDFLHHPERYSKIGANMPKGALLVGPPGTGKTLLAQAVAGEADVPFFSISGSEFVEMFVGRGASRVRALFKQANEKAPCIVFIDEIDTIGKKRGGNIGGNDEREQTLNQLLTEMDGFDGSKGVVILAATNRPDSLDEALLRPGRFDRRIPVELPDLKGREDILKVHAQRIILEDKIDYNIIARATAGASGAELANIINESALRAVRENRDKVTQEDLEESVEVVIAGHQRKNAVISDEEKEIIAYHEVGHALVAAKQTDSAPVHKITIIPRTSGALGYTMQIAEEEKVLMTKDEAFNKIATFTGGRAAEDLIFNLETSGASNDIEQATKLARAMITRFGMSEKFGMVALETVSNPYLNSESSLACSQKTASMVDEEVQILISQAYDKAYNILKENEGLLHEISNFLLEEETITGEQFMDIMRRYEEDREE